MQLAISTAPFRHVKPAVIDLLREQGGVYIFSKIRDCGKIHLNDNVVPNYP